VYVASWRPTCLLVLEEQTLVAVGCAHLADFAKVGLALSSTFVPAVVVSAVTVLVLAFVPTVVVSAVTVLVLAFVPTVVVRAYITNRQATDSTRVPQPAIYRRA
jgi:hypothetical protein